MNSLEIQGLRSLSNTGEIRIAPITILLGTNSSGKSTFLRTLPLLRQTAEVRTSEPLLWYGRLVDFGSFDEALSHHQDQDRIKIKCQLDLPSEIIYAHSFHIDPNKIDKIKPRNSTIEFTIRRTGNSEENSTTGRIPSFVSQIKFKFLDVCFEFVFSAPFQLESAKFDDVDISKSIKATYIISPSQTIFPNFIKRREEFDKSNVENFETIKTIDYALHQKIQDLVHGRTKKTSISNLILHLEPISKDEFLAQIKDSQKNEGLWRKSVLDWNIDTPDFLTIRQLLWSDKLDELIELISYFLQREFQQISYITPLRAAAERYYRHQGLATNELDPKGENFAEYLRSLTRRQREDLQSWLGRALDAYIDLEESKGHVSLYLIDDKTKAKVNLADTGFGYSQLLPIAVQLWALKGFDLRGKNFTNATTLAIEQPELHLHPKIQAKVADLLMLAIDGDKSKSIKIVVETHSEALINRLGKLIQTGKLDEDSVNIVLFDKETFDSPSSVQTTTFDSNGFLKNWPLGFFSTN
ncbi:MAG: AAA family ATPase [Proteobacteria bacterium]|nr:AAA family ATPase [Pseudomonadota bacterium]